MTVKIAIVFYSKTGNVAKLAEAIGYGAREAGAEVKLLRVHDLAPQSRIDADAHWKQISAELGATYAEPALADLEWADAIIFGSPTRFGVVSADLKAFIDTLGGLWFQGKLVNKVGSAFSTTSTKHGGNEMTLQSLMTPMMHLGMILVTPGYTDPAMFSGGSPYGATAVVGGANDQPPAENDLAAARHQGKRVAEVTTKLLS